jgi:K+-sensing histidine kinase KdpD
MLVNKKYISVKFSESKLKKRHKELAVLYDIGNDLTRSLTLTDVLDSAIKDIRLHFKVDAVRIYLMDETQDHLELVAYKGISKKDVTELRKIPVGTGFSGKAAKTKSFIAQRVSDLKNGARAQFLLDKGFKVIMCVPLIVRGEVLGVMNLASKRMFSLTQKKIDLILAIGNQIAIAINVARLHDQIESKVEEIEKKKKDLEFFAYTISHDLKNPAIGISGFARLLGKRYEDKLDEKGKTYCDHMRKAAEQIERFTLDINEYIKSKEVALTTERTNVKEILRQIRDDFSPLLKARNVRWTEPESLPEIMVNQLAMTRVFRNLIDNALKHGGDKLTKIDIEYGHDPHFHIISFTNDGTTMKKKDSELVFDMFRRLPQAKVVDGSGLGLAIVKEIVEKHGGKVWLESGRKKETTFYVAIPKDLQEQAGHA